MKGKRKLILWITAVVFVFFILPMGIAYFIYHDTLDLIKCEKGIEYCIDLIDDFVDTRSLCNEVYAEAVKYKHPAYDIFYLIAARRNNAKLLTCDKKLKKIAIEMGVKLIA